jgi:hypothetical protein
MDVEETLKLRLQRTISMGDSSLTGNGSSTTVQGTTSIGVRTMVRSAGLWLLFGLWSWHYTRYLISSDTSIVAKVPPYQRTAAGDVILDFTLNDKVSDPPIIPCEYDSGMMLWFLSWSLFRKSSWAQPFYLYPQTIS